MKHKIMLRTALAAALLPLLGVAVSGPSHAADAASVEARLDSLEARWDRMETELAALRSAIESSQSATAPAVPEAIAAVSGSVAAMGKDLETVRSDVAAQGQAIAAESAARQRDIAISSYGAVNFGKRSGQDSIIDAESFELVFSGQPHERISFFSELEFERAAAVGAGGCVPVWRFCGADRRVGRADRGGD